MSRIWNQSAEVDNKVEYRADLEPDLEQKLSTLE